MTKVAANLAVLDAGGNTVHIKGWTSNGVFFPEHYPAQLITQFNSEVYIHSTLTFTRPADTTAYTAPTTSAAGDLIANSTTNTSVVPLNFQFPPIDTDDTGAAGEISFIQMNTSGTAPKTIRIHFYKGTSPVVTNGDNGTIAVSNHTQDNYLGSADVAMSPSVSGAQGQNDAIRIPYSLTVTAGVSQNVYALCEALTAYTPTSAGTHSVKVGVLRAR